MTDSLDVFPEDWDRALAVVAHPDDLEFGAAAAIARWTAQGKTVTYLLITDGEAGIDAMAPEVCGPLRKQEEIDSARIVGVDTVEFLGRPDGLVVADVELRRDLAAAIRRHRPDVVVSINFREHWGGRGWNHVDHRATGIALLDAARDAGNRWLFPGFGGEPWSGVRFALVNASPATSHAVDVGESLALGQASLREHRAYLDGLRAPGAEPTDEDPTAFLVENATQVGKRFGVEHAVAFELVAF